MLRTVTRFTYPNGDQMTFTAIDVEAERVARRRRAMSRRKSRRAFRRGTRTHKRNLGVNSNPMRGGIRL